jgi:outer membrane protein TolC
LRAQRRGAIDAYDQALAQYKQTVLLAFQNTADVLQALQNDKDFLKSQELAERSARDSLAITQKQYKLGGVSYLTLLTSQRQYQTAKINLIQAKAARFTDTAALFQALGGGWWHTS